MPAGLPRISETIKDVAYDVKTNLVDFVDYLDFPTISEYLESCRLVFHDVTVASKSAGKLGYLTFRPVVLLLMLLAKHLFILLKFLSKHLFHQGIQSAKKGYYQLKFATIWLLNKQKSLSRSAVLFEIGVITFAITCYLLRRYIKKKKYIERVTSWYRRTKRKCKQRYNRVIFRVSQTSLFLAMLLPHALFIAVAITFKLLFPRVLAWLATETYSTAIISLWYPLLWTISLLHQWRTEQYNIRSIDANTGSKDNKQSKSIDDSTEPVTPQSKSIKRTGVYPKTTPSIDKDAIPKSSKKPPIAQRWLNASVTKIRRHANEQSGDDTKNSGMSMEEEAKYWLKYWVVHALLFSTCRMLYLMPVVGRFVSRSPMLINVLEQFRLLFYFWMFGLMPLTSGAATAGSSDVNGSNRKSSQHIIFQYDNRPLELLYKKLCPVSQNMHKYVSNAIPDGVWASIVSKVTSVLDIAVLVKFLSTESKDKIIHIVEESESLIVPAITLFMPGFLTEYGVIYVKSIIVSAKCSSDVVMTSMPLTMSYLQFWVLHSLLSAILDWWSPILWWVPLSTHATFLLWCYLMIPKTSSACYGVLEDELMAFGLLARCEGPPGSSYNCANNDKFELEIEKTVSYRVLSALASRLPSASEQDDVKENDRPKDDNEETTKGNAAEAI